MAERNRSGGAGGFGSADDDPATAPEDDFLEIPLFPLAPVQPAAARFSANDRLLGRFEIVRLIGRGGMGEVYAAHDSELGTAVALKTILPGLALNARAVGKIRGEVRQARTVAHPNVCRVYDLFTAATLYGPIQFLTMELLAGPTLADVLRANGPFAQDAAVAIARDIAAALDATHRQRIIHRDLKPANVVLVGEGDARRAVVTDFGLSIQLTDPGGRLTLSDAAAGTEDYVPPEQHVSGTIGAAADIYAFGVLLHELMSGKRPGKGGALDARLPENWRSTIALCLHEDPSLRPPTAAAVIERLDVAPSHGRYRFAGSFVALAVAVLALIEPISRSYSTKTVDTAKVVLTGVTNETGLAELDAVGDMLRYQLQQSAVLTAVSPERTGEIMRLMTIPDAPLTAEAAREVAWRVGAHGIVSGRVRGGGSDFVLTVRYEARQGRPDTSGMGHQRSFEASNLASLRSSIGDAARWLRRTAGEPAMSIAQSDRRVDDVTSMSWQAVALFTRAQRLIAASRPEDALALLNEAVRLDPDFAFAWMRIGDVLMTQRQSEQAYATWTRALAAFERRRLSPREEYAIRGMFASDTEDHAGAERVYRLYLLSFPNDFAPYFYIARPLMMLGRIDEGIRMLEEAGRRDPSQFSVPAQLAMFKFRAGRWNDTDHHITAVRVLGQRAWADCLEGQRAFLRGAYATARQHFAALRHADVPLLRARGPLLEANVLADRGDLPAAMRVLDEGTALDATRGDQQAHADKLLAWAELALRSGQRLTCRDLCVRARQLDRSPIRIAHMASLMARAGDPAAAGRLLTDLPENSRSTRVVADRLRIQGEILLARGNTAAAWNQFQRAAALEPPGVLPEYAARGAAAAGEVGTAIALYERMASEPGYYWRYPDTDPGRWLASLEIYLRLTKDRPTTRRPEIARMHRALVTGADTTNTGSSR